MSISIDSLSFSSIINSLTNYFETQAESQKWKDFYESSTGKLFIRLLSAFGSFISYMVTVSRRENFITYAQNRTSLIGIAQNLGYSTSRGKNETIELTVVPNMTGFIPAYTQVGTVKNLDLVTVNDTQLNSGVSSSIELYIGNLNSESLTLTTDSLSIFRFSSTNVSDYIRLKLNNSLVPLSDSNELRDLNNDMYVAISNPLGAVDVMYLQSGSYKYASTDILTLEYIELSSVSYTVSDILFNYGTVSSLTRVLPFVDVESNNNIAVNAPLYHETQVLVRGRNDYLKELLTLGYNLASTNSHDFTPAIVDLSYVKSDYTNMPPAEQTNILASLEERRAMGIPLPRIKYPKHVKLALSFNIKKNSNSILNLTDVQSDIESLTSGYEQKLAPSIDLELLEQDVDDLSYVKRSRINVISNSRVNSNKYRLGDFTTVQGYDNYIFMAYDFLGTSGTLEPTWSYNVGDTIIDNNIVWKCIPRYGLNSDTWYSQKSYKVGDSVISTSNVTPSLNVMFECIEISKYSGSSAPNFTTILKDFTEDNDIIWVCKTLVTGDSAWLANTKYSLGDSVVYGSFSYECVGFKGTSDTSVPTMKVTDHYAISEVDIVNGKFSISGDIHTIFRQHDTIEVLSSTGNDGYYTVSSSSFDGTKTNITVAQPIPSSIVDGNIYTSDTYTIDGGILWKYFTSDTTEFDYSWNAYLVITNTVVLPTT